MPSNSPSPNRDMGSPLPISPAEETELKESTDWHAIYDSGEQVRRRRAAIPAKLSKIGVAAADRDARILDLCCGNGETLDTLYQMGFRNLSGLDVVINRDLAGDTRFSSWVGDATAIPVEDQSQDWILIVHALHHLGPAANVEALVKECFRVLKPGGRLSIIDFPSSLQIRLAFWFFRHNFWLITPYLKYFGKLIQEEWHFLRFYLPEWPKVRSLLLHGPFETERFHREFFYYYLTLRKPLAGARCS